MRTPKGSTYLKQWAKIVRKSGKKPCLFCLCENPATKTYCGGCRKKLD